MKASRRASAFSHAPTLAQLAPSQAVDEELLWFFNAEDGDFASVSNFGRMLAPVTEDGEWRTRGGDAADGAKRGVGTSSRGRGSRALPERKATT